MPADEPRVERLRPVPELIVAVLAFAAAALLLLINLPAQRTGVIWGWLPGLAGAGAAVHACRRTSRAESGSPAVTRLFRHLTVVVALAAAGYAGQVLQVVLHSPGSGPQHYSWFSIGAYTLAMVMLLWTLLRLPVSRTEPRERVVRFVLDAATIAITVGIFAYYLGVDADHGSRPSLPLTALVVLGLILALALMKIAVSGLDGLDQITARLLALAVGAGASGSGALAVFLAGHPDVRAVQVSLPATVLCIALAADRQRRAAPAGDGRTSRAVSLIPYAAVAATDGLLLVVSQRAGAQVLTVASAAVLLTSFVVIRQVSALWENGRLLRRVDVRETQLKHRANHDDLTDLPNRTLFEQETSRALERAGSSSMSLALIDLDDFKAINDRLGHAVGDALLVVVAQRLQESVRQDDVVARLGGDEFGLLLHGLRGAEAHEVLARITEALARPVHALGYDLLVRASIGLAQVGPDAGPQELLRRADLAMYAAKERGKGRHAVYDAEMEKHQAADAELGAELRRALDDGEFSLVYQPIVRLPDGAWTGLETLVRWHSPQRGFVGPDKFIPMAERTGLIVPLGDWILRTALRQAREWDERYGPAAPREIGVNVSARQLQEPGFADDVRDALADSGFDPERVVVEVTETAVFGGGVALDTLLALVGLGVKVALDDFGTGHSSLGLLRTCPSDILKLDKSFVDGIGGSSEEAVIATAMIQITDGLHLQAIAEGVETAEQAETLHRLGYRFAQGYHFSRPLTPEQITEKLGTSVPV